MGSDLYLGFIGFGEAGYHLAKGLRGAGLANIAAYDINTSSPTHGAKIQERAADSGVTLFGSNAELASRCDITVKASNAQSI